MNFSRIAHTGDGRSLGELAVLRALPVDPSRTADKLGTTRCPQGWERWSAYVEFTNFDRRWKWTDGPFFGAWLVRRLERAPHQRIPAADVVREFEALLRGRKDRTFWVEQWGGRGWEWLEWVVGTGSLPVAITWRPQ